MARSSANKQRSANTKVQLAADFLSEEMMQVQTLTHMEFEPAPVQIGEPFRCWECGSPDQGGMFLIIDHSPVEAFANHIYYMRLTCGHNPRCVRLGDAIALLRPLDRSIGENLASVREGLAHLAKARKNRNRERSGHDPLKGEPEMRAERQETVFATSRQG